MPSLAPWPRVRPSLSAPSRARLFACSSCSATWSVYFAGIVDGENALSARSEAPRLGHLVSVLEFGAELPGGSGYAEDEKASKRRVALPISRLGIPTTGWRPDVLGVATIRLG